MLIRRIMPVCCVSRVCTDGWLYDDQLAPLRTNSSNKNNNLWFRNHEMKCYAVIISKPKLCSIAYRVLSWNASEHTCALCVFPLAMFATTQDAHIEIGQSCINNLLDFPILMIISEISNFDTVHILYIYIYKNENNTCFSVVLLCIHDSKYGKIRVLFASTYTAKQLKALFYLENKGIAFKARLACTTRYKHGRDHYLSGMTRA